MRFFVLLVSLIMLCSLRSQSQIRCVYVDPGTALHASSPRVHAGLRPFARICPTDISFMDMAVPVASPSSSSLPDGDTISCLLALSSHGACSIGLFIDSLDIAPGGGIYFYGSDGGLVAGPFTMESAGMGKSLRTVQIPGDSVVVELRCPSSEKPGNFHISKLYYGSDDLLTGTVASSKSLAKLTVCNSERNVFEYRARDYTDIAHAVLKYSFDKDGYSYFCTGTLVNSLRTDTMPLVLTAAHCICDNEVARSAVFYFNYDANDNSGVFRGEYQSISGAELVATAAKRPFRNTFGSLSREEFPEADYTLLRLSKPIPASFKPYFAGLSLNTSDYMDTLVCLHHPNGATKKISVSYSRPYIDNYPDEDADCHYKPMNHWHIAKWSVGTTEGGSSGSPLLNTRKKIIGTLSGGYASCSKPTDDYFQMLSKAWAISPEPDKQLKYWLTPNSDIDEIPPFDPYNVVSNLPKSRVSVSCDPDSTVAYISWAVENGVVYKSEFDLVKVLSSGYIMPRLDLSGRERLVFRARSTTGPALLAVSQNMRPQRFRGLDTLDVDSDIQEYSIDLSNLGQDYTYIRFSTGAGSSVYIFDLRLELATDDSELTGYQLYCNDELVRTYGATDRAFCAYPINHGESYSFYVLNKYGDRLSGLGNIVTVAPGFKPQSTPVSEIDFVANSVNLYPNPARESATLHFGVGINDCVIHIVDTNGRECRAYNLHHVPADYIYQMSLSGLKNGVYYIKVCSGGKIFNYKRLVIL